MKKVLKIVGIVFAALIVLGVLGNLISGDDDKSSSSASVASTESIASVDESTEKDKNNAAASITNASTEVSSNESADVDTTDESPADATVEENVDEESDPVDEWTDEQKFEFYMAYAEIILNDAYDGNYDIYHEDDIITVKVWKDGIAQGAMLAKNGNKDLLKSWDTMVENTRVMAKTLYDELETVNATNKHVSVNIMNDQNKENVLVTYLDGVVVYDAVHAK